MGNIWQLQEAKNKFSSLVAKVRRDGPQIVTKHGKKSVVVLSIEEYERLTGPKSSLLEFFQNSPLKNTSLDLERDKGLARDLEL